MTRPACPGLYNNHLLQTGTQAFPPLREHQPQINGQDSLTEVEADRGSTKHKTTLTIQVSSASHGKAARVYTETVENE